MHRRATLLNRVLAAVLMLAVYPAGAASQHYAYQVTYRGVFSLGQDMQIADLALATTPAPSGGLRETRLEVSSEAYPTVESFYPIRYRFRSWTEAADGHLVGFEAFEQTRKERHRLYLRDDSELGVRRLDLKAGAGQAEIAQLDAGQRPPAAGGIRALFDRLGLLQQVRVRPLYDGAEYRLPVTNGKESMIYRVSVEGSQMLDLDGHALPAWKVRFDGREIGPEGREETAHRPVFIWFSQDDERIPLRADARHAVGLFRIELKGSAGLPRLASSDT